MRGEGGLAVEPCAGGVTNFGMGLGPMAKVLERLDEAFAHGGEAVFDTGGYHAEDFAMDEAIALHSAQGLGEDLG